jgi:xanthine dehydrogenase YagR molybdenum-binding subunit
VPVNADVGDIEVLFVEEEDRIVNAIFHATGERIRALPITPDKLL